jgi:hypothetical protein
MVAKVTRSLRYGHEHREYGRKHRRSILAALVNAAKAACYGWFYFVTNLFTSASFTFTGRAARIWAIHSFSR